MTQRDQILSHLRTGAPITPGEALNFFGCFRLAARIDELRKAGYAIEVQKVPTRGGAHVAQYRLVEAVAA